MPLGPRLAGAGPPEAAQALHHKAADHFDRGDYGEAVRMWLEADRITPHWKFALNLAKAYYKLNENEPCWRWGRVALDREPVAIPKPALTDLQRALGECRKALLATHALAELRLEPPDSPGVVVKLEGVAWPAPRRIWTTRSQSRLQIERNGETLVDEVWRHPIGVTTLRTLTVGPLAASRIRVEGEPAGANVTVDGRSVGTLPDAVAPNIRPGPHNVAVSLPGFQPWTRRVEVAAGETMSMVVALLPAPSGPPPATDRPAYTAWGWSTLGTGLVFAGVGAGLLGRSFTIQDDLRELNERHRNDDLDFASYSSQFGALRDTQEIMYPSGIALLGVGGALTATGILLLLLPDAPTDASLSVVPRAGGGALHFHGRF